MPRKKKDNTARNVALGGAAIAGLGGAAYLLSKRGKPKFVGDLVKRSGDNVVPTPKPTLPPQLPKSNTSPVIPGKTPKVNVVPEPKRYRRKRVTNPAQTDVQTVVTPLPGQRPPSTLGRGRRKVRSSTDPWLTSKEVANPPLIEGAPPVKPKLLQPDTKRPTVRDLIRRVNKGERGGKLVAKPPITKPQNITDVITGAVPQRGGDLAPIQGQWRPSKVDSFYRRGKDGKRYIVRGYTRRVRRAVGDTPDKAKRFINVDAVTVPPDALPPARSPRTVKEILTERKKQVKTSPPQQRVLAPGNDTPNLNQQPQIQSAPTRRTRKRTTVTPTPDKSVAETPVPGQKPESQLGQGRRKERSNRRDSEVVGRSKPKRVVKSTSDKVIKRRRTDVPGAIETRATRVLPEALPPARSPRSVKEILAERVEKVDTPPPRQLVLPPGNDTPNLNQRPQLESAPKRKTRKRKTPQQETTTTGKAPQPGQRTQSQLGQGRRKQRDTGDVWLTQEGGTNISSPDVLPGVESPKLLSSATREVYDDVPLKRTGRKLAKRPPNRLERYLRGTDVRAEGVKYRLANPPLRKPGSLSEVLPKSPPSRPITDSLADQLRRNLMDETPIPGESTMVRGAKRYEIAPPFSQPTESAYRELGNEITVAIKREQDLAQLPRPDVDAYNARSSRKGRLVKRGDVPSKPDVKSIRRKRLDARTEVRVRQSSFEQVSREIDELTDKIETDAKREIALKQRDFENSLKDLEQELKQYKPQQFNKPPITQSIETQLKDIQQDLDDYLDDPFSTTNFFETGVAKSKRLRETLEAELRDVDSKLSQPELFKRKTAEIEKKLTILEDEFKKALVKQQQLKQDAINNLKLRVETELGLLQNMKPEDIVNETGLSRETVDVLLKEKEEWIAQYKTFLNRKNFGVESPFQRKVRRFKTDVRNSYSTSRYRGEQQLAQLRSYREQLIGLRSNIDRVPDKKWKLSRAQRSRLAETENFRNLYGQYYPRLVDKIGELERHNNTFSQRYSEYSTKLNQSIDRIFSNDLTDTYTGLLENEAKEVAELYDAIKFKMGRLEKVRDPKVWEEYLDPATVDGELLDLNWKPSFDPNQRLLTGSTGGNKVLGGTGGKYTQDVKTLSQAMHIKRKFIDGKQGFVQKLNNDIWNVHLAFKHKNGEEFINNYLSDLQNKQDEIVKLYSGYQTKQNKLLTEIQQLYERSIVEGGEGQDVNSFLYAKTVLDERLKESVKRRLKSQLLRKKGYDDAFLLLQGDIEYGKTHLGEVGKLKAKYEVDADDNVRLQKIVNSVDDLNDDVYKTLLEKSTTVNDLAKKKRDTIAEIYYAMDSNGLKLEGDKSVLSKIEVRPDFSTLDEKELKFVKSLTQYQQDLLKEFANQGLHKEFEKLYYANSVGYLLRHNIGDFKLSQGVSQRLGVGQNELLGKAQQILGGRNRNKSLVSSKVSEVQGAVRELNTVLETLGEPQVRLAGYITDAKGNRIPLRGFLTAQNLPKLEAESPLNLNERLLKKAQELTGLDKKSVIITEDDTIRVRNQLTRRLMSLLGVTENGTPFTDPTLIQQLSGMGVRSREDLLKLIDQIEGGLYKRSSLNTLLAANQRNFNEARKQGDALYMYNFNREDDVSLFA